MSVPHRKVTKLSPWNAVTGKSTNPYRDYKVMRRDSIDLDVWIKRQYAQQEAQCFYCSISLKDKRLNVEHVVALSNGGETSSKNMVLSCARCNKEKGSSTLSKTFISNKRQNFDNGVKRSRKEYGQELDYQRQLGAKLRWIND